MKFKKKIIASITILIFAGIVITLAFKFNNNTTTQSGNTTNSSSEVNVTEESKSEITVPKKEDKKEDIKTEDKEQRETIFKLFEIEPLLNKHIVLLSSGELRKYQLAKTLLTKPDLLIMDNPFIG